MQRISTTVAMAGVVMILTSGAQAQNVPIDECLWSKAPQATRDAMIAAVPSAENITKAMSAWLGPETAGPALQACGGPLTREGSQLLGNARMAHALETGAMRQLKAHHPALTDQAVDAAWAKLPANVRERMTGFFDPSRGSAASEAEFQAAVEPFMRALDISDSSPPQDTQLMVIYTSGRGEIEILRRARPAL